MLAAASLLVLVLLALLVMRVAGDYHGTPSGRTAIHAGDTLVLYGRVEAVAELDRRSAGPAGDAEDLDAIEEQRRLGER